MFAVGRTRLACVPKYQADVIVTCGRRSTHHVLTPSRFRMVRGVCYNPSARPLVVHTMRKKPTSANHYFSNISYSTTFVAREVPSMCHSISTFIVFSIRRGCARSRSVSVQIHLLFFLSCCIAYPPLRLVFPPNRPYLRILFASRELLPCFVAVANTRTGGAEPPEPGHGLSPLRQRRVLH